MKTYTGKIMSNGAPVVVVTIEGTPKVNYTLSHVMFHSTGFAWGYGGSGPTDLALSILADYFGESPEQVIRFANFGNLGERCTRCRGEGFLNGSDDPFDPELDSRSLGRECPTCSGSGAIYPPPCRAWDLHHMFLWQFVVTWAQDRAWELTQTEIEAFLALDPQSGMLPRPEVTP